MLLIMDFKKKVFAIVGASNNAEKYGYKVTEALLKVTEKVIPINPNESQIIGQKCFSSISQVKEKIDVLVFVVPPAITLEVLKNNFLRAKIFWFQPGSFDGNVIQFCEENGLEYENKKCIIKESEQLSQ